MSFKNKLQEIFQKYGLALPLYSTIEQPGGFGTVTVLCNGDMFYGSLSNSKQDAEQSAASAALRFVQENISCFVIDKDIKQLGNIADISGEVLIIVDVTYCSEKQFMKLHELDKIGYTVTGIATMNYNNMALARKYINVKYVDSILHEMVCAKMVIDATVQITNLDKFMQVYLVSNDKFIVNATKLLRNVIEDTQLFKHVYQSDTIEQLIIDLVKFVTV